MGNFYFKKLAICKFLGDRGFKKKFIDEVQLKITSVAGERGIFSDAYLPQIFGSEELANEFLRAWEEDPSLQEACLDCLTKQSEISREFAFGDWRALQIGGLQ